MRQITVVPSRERFEELAKLGNVVPVFVDLVADDQTPASAFQKLDESGYSFLLNQPMRQPHICRRRIGWRLEVAPRYPAKYACRHEG